MFWKWHNSPSTFYACRGSVKNYAWWRSGSSDNYGIQQWFGLLEWRDEHIVKSCGTCSVIIDNVFMDKSTFIKRFLVCPIMLFPIFIRRVTYKIWFYLLEGKKWSSFKTIWNHYLKFIFFYFFLHDFYIFGELNKKRYIFEA